MLARQTWLFIPAIVAILTASLACQSSPRPTPYPTYTPFPTWTPAPTATLMSTKPPATHRAFNPKIQAGTNDYASPFANSDSNKNCYSYASTHCHTNTRAGARANSDLGIHSNAGAYFDCYANADSTTHRYP